ncbi:TPA: group II intron maturase-specific domain-containing protein [Legionella pneumophila]
MTLKLRRGNWRNNTSLSLQELADFINPMLRGWIEYYGKYSRSSMYRVWRCVNNMLLAWAKKKYKSLNNSRTKAGKLMERIHKEMPALFVHWREGMFGALT